MFNLIIDINIIFINLIIDINIIFINTECYIYNYLALKNIHLHRSWPLKKIMINNIL